ncbi:MAG: ABC transporter substrate-binding protein [Bacteroidales bacterium]|nr:ABC transporter substrate-binding protein [Bacteroidales bacterium]
MKRMALFLVVCLLFPGCKKDNAHPDTLYLVADLTISAGSGFEYYGNEVKNGLDLWKDSLKMVGAEILYEDNQGTLPQTVSVFNKYAGRTDVPLILTNNSPLGAAVRNFAEKKQVNLLALVAGDLDFCDGYSWVFRDAIMQDQEGEVLADAIKSNPSIKRIAMCGVNDAYGLDGMEELRKRLEGSDVRVLQTISYDKGSYDFKFILNNLLSTSPDAIYFAGREQYIISFVNQLRERNGSIPVYTCDAFESPTVLQGLGKNAEGIVFASYWNHFDSADAEAFLSLYRQTYGKDPGIYAIDAYVCGQYLYHIISEGHRTASEIAEALASLSFNSSVKGTLVTRDHSVISHVGAFTIDENGQKVLLKNE